MSCCANCGMHDLGSKLFSMVKFIFSKLLTVTYAEQHIIILIYTVIDHLRVGMGN